MDFLDIKHVQLDTMAGHFLLPALLAYPLQATAAPGNGANAAKTDAKPGRKVLAKMCAFFSDHRKDAGETLFTAYTGGAYSKVS